MNWLNSFTLEDIDKRITEQTGKLEKEIAQSKPADFWGEGEKKEQPEKEQSQDTVIDLEAERKRKREAYKEQLPQQFKDQSKNKGSDDRTLER